MFKEERETSLFDWGMIGDIGEGRPNLGSTMDIHTSSRNLIFPHHENEIAIAEALTGKPLANYWLHSELVLVDGKNMSSDAGNNVTLKELLASWAMDRNLGGR